MSHAEDVELLKKMIAVDSIFPNEAKLAKMLAEMLKEAGFKVELQEFLPGRFNVLAERKGEKGREEPPIVLYGHIDTVPAYGYEQVKQNPFSADEKDGKIVGLGSYDMKAGIAAIIRAVSEIKNGRHLKIMFVSDEEADSQGCFAACKAGFIKGCSLALATEISDVNDINEKTRTITLGRRGRVQYEITVPGKSFHAARMEHGISAITEASKLAIEIDKMNSTLPSHPELGKGNQFVRGFHSQSVSLSVPDEAVLIVDRHIVTPETPQSSLDEIKSLIQSLYRKGTLTDCGKKIEVKIKPRNVPYLLPYVTPKENPEVKKLAEIIKRKLGVEAGYNCGKSVADENVVAMEGIPVIAFGPIGGGEHSSGEWVSKRSYLELIDVIKEFIA